MCINRIYRIKITTTAPVSDIKNDNISILPICRPFTYFSSKPPLDIVPQTTSD